MLAALYCSVVRACAMMLCCAVQEVPGDMTDYWTTPVSHFIASPGQSYTAEHLGRHIAHPFNGEVFLGLNKEAM